MGERKRETKRYPPDFDPEELPRVRRSEDQQTKVRMMLPMSVRCGTCGNYISKGTKFNSRKEDVVGETYLGSQIVRFYFKCTKCSAEFTIKTDPWNSDYVVELGATRNFDPWREQDEVVESGKRKREAEEIGDPMKSLENRTMDSKREMDILAGLDEMKSLNSRRAAVSIDAGLENLQHSSAAKERKLKEEDEVLTKSIIFRTSKDFVRRIEDEDSEDEEDLTQPSASNDESLNTLKVTNALMKRKFYEELLDKPTDSLTKATSSDISNDRGNYVGSQDRSETKLLSNSSSVRIAVVKKAGPTSSPSIALQSLCQTYKSSDDED